MVQIPAPLPPQFDPNLLLLSDGPGILLGLVIAALTATTIILWPIMRALGRRMEGKAVPDQSLRAEIEQLQQRVAELELERGHVAELEERVEFAERLLAQPKDAERLQR